MRELSKHSLFVGNGRKFITESKGDIAFNYSRNRVRLHNQQTGPDKEVTKVEFSNFETSKCGRNYPLN